ncbi:FtsJ-like methyltransferase-domain-containing protein [Zychaea mexicana]|uniref:FtsJ-like methyltransferase-domain-containing protein n=1 Tax=Zychaea mexicana TaxID=64656 RepID=UPI0022FE3BC6|nr:FtsJ-like methyltransferase-domain-containing protein [Zychaea mexicana]KAI9490189.1 FtsJ-like methyltransferase-domain-containing protein [Zychaea mexicana]
MSDHGDLYTDDDPEYRNTRTVSGIPPPSLRSLRAADSYPPLHSRHSRDGRPLSVPEPHATNSDHRAVPEYRGVPPPRSAQPPPPLPPKLDMRVSTDFLKCDREHQLAIQDLPAMIRVREPKEQDYFWIPKDLVEQTNAMRSRVKGVSYEARARSNPYESINRSIFMSRAATKLAALDATFALTATTETNKPFTFADICGGPGGFSEYLLWRVHSWGGTAHGYGITIKSQTHEEVNWHTEKFRKDIPLNFTPVEGADGTGNLYKEANILAFGGTVRQHTQGQGVDLAVADGGFDFTGQEQHQEHSARRLLLCEIITMLTCLRQGGSFVCKLFEVSEEFTADMLWLLYQLFDMICITKPLTSRPANSERYIVCKGLRVSFPEDLITTLLSVNRSLETQPERIGSFVPRAVLEDDEDFVNYVKMRNIRFASKQLEALGVMEQYIRQPDRPPVYDQEWVRRQCLKEWRLPMDRRESPEEQQ